jgi:hypothetical protein
MSLTSIEIEAESGSVLPERATPFVISLGHFGSNFAITRASNSATAVNGGFFSLGNTAVASAGQVVVVNQG